MKKIYKTLLAVPLSLSFLLMGTACDYEITKRPGKKTNSSEDSDEIIVEGWIATDKTEYEYDESGKLLKEISYRWIMDTNTWEGTWMNEFGYNEGEDEWFQQKQYQWDTWENTWRPDFRCDNINGTHYYYNWSNEINDWFLNAKQVSIIDEDDIPVREICYSWSEAENDWILTGKGVYSYDNRMATQSIEWFRLNEANEWVYDRKTEFEYSEDWNTCTTSDYMWINGAWKGLQKDIYERDKDYNDLSYVRFYWFESINDWKEASKEVYEYNEKKNRILELHYKWSDEMNDFVENGKSVYKYNGNGGKILFVSFAKQNIFD